MAEDNLALCFPQLPARSRESIKQASIEHSACAVFELAWLWYRPMPSVLQTINSLKVHPDFKNSAGGKIVISPHLGSWEILNLWLAEQGPLISLYKPSDDETLDHFIREKRSRNGAQLAPANTAGLRHLFRGLRAGATCLVLPDQRPADKTAGINAPFYGVPALTSLLVSNICRKQNCEVYIASALRDTLLGQYQLRLDKLDRDQFMTSDVDGASYLNHCIEQCIGSDLEQYQWIYRRFDRPVYSALHTS